MKRVLLLIVLILISSLLFLIFHDKGNDYLKPYLATYLESQLENNMSVEVEHLKIDQDHIELIALLNKLTKINVEGQYSLMNQTLDIDYQLKADSFNDIKSNIDVNGTVKGHFSNMDVEGKGEALKSKINYSLNLKENLLKNIKIKILKADIAQFLLLAGQPHYASGKVDIDIDIPSLEENQTAGSANILLHETKLNEKVLNKSFNLNIPKKTLLTGTIKSKINQHEIHFTSNINSSLSVIKLNKALYSLDNNSFSSNYSIKIPKLSKLSFVTQQKLYGMLEATGSMQFKNKIFTLNALTKSLGGISKIILNDNQLNINIDNSKIEKLLYLLGEKSYATGLLIGDIKISNLKDLTGTFNLSTQQAKTVHKTLKKELTLDLGKSITFQMKTEGNIKSNLAHIHTKLDSELFTLHSNDMLYDLKHSLFTASYLLSVPKLSKLNALAGKKLQGALTLNGKIKSDKTLLFTGNTKDLGGTLNFKLLNQQLNSNINGVSVQKLMHMLDYPQIFKATIDGDFNYDLKNRKGLFTSKLNKAQLLANDLTQLVKQIRGIDLTKERYNETTFVARLNNNDINFDFNAKSRNVTMALPNGHINKLNNSINANYKLKIENKDIAGKIKGNISHPHISIDSSQFIKDNVIDAIQEHIGDDKLNDLGIGEKEKDIIKNVLGNLFK